MLERRDGTREEHGRKEQRRAASDRGAINRVDAVILRVNQPFDGDRGPAIDE
jgi:hypothetical protein